MNDIYNMNLFDSISIRYSSIENTQLTRVPGGWIFEVDKDSGMTSVFIPYNEEFKVTAK